MATQVGSTRNAAGRNFIAVYGGAGVGKTSLLASLNDLAIEKGGRALQIDLDDGNLSLAGYDIPSVKCDYLQDVYDVLGWIQNDPNWQAYTHLMIDGCTVLGESILTQFLASKKDGRAAYGDMAETFNAFIEYLKKQTHLTIVLTFQQRQIESEGRLIYSMDLPGRKLSPKMPYKFDEVLCMRIMSDTEGKPTRVLQTQPDMQYDAKDRSGKLQQFELPDLRHVINRIQSV